MSLSVWSTLENIAKWGVTFIGIITIITGISSIFLIYKKPNRENIKMNLECVCTISIFIFIFSLFIIYIPIYSVYESLRQEQDIINNRIESYNDGISFRNNGDWYNAVNSFKDAENYQDSEILGEYCLYIYLGEKHPDWVPWMGINEIKGK